MKKMLLPLLLLALLLERGSVVAFYLSSKKNPSRCRTMVERLHGLSMTATEKRHGNQENVYDASSITVLQGLEAVRKRPGMYIGSTGSKGLHHLVFEVIDNSVDEALAGHCSEIVLTLHEDGGIEVRDNGRGIPCSTHPTTGKSTLETVLCVLHAGGKFGGDSSGYKVSGGLHGVGISVVNALSKFLKVDVVRDGRHYSMTFSRGVPITSIEERPALATEERGTRVLFHPDEEIFKSGTEFEFERISLRMDELAYLNAGLTIKMTDRRKLTAQEADPGILAKTNEKQRVFHHDGGIMELIRVICQGKANLYSEIDVISIKEELKNVSVEVAMRWSSDQFDDNLFGFANGIRTSDGGSHLDGLKAAISRVINNFAKKNGKVKEGSIPGEFIREGLTAVISVKVPEPEFEGQTKTRLGNPEVRQIVDSVVSDKLQTLSEWNPNLFHAICNKALTAQNAALAAKAARDMVRRKSVLQSTILPGKLADCSNRNPAEAELYIVEGDSAAGSAKLGRDRRFQAILPLKGKILNIEKASSEKIYQNAELQALISAIGLGIRGTALEVENLRYHRIIIMTDADVDGAHIRLLLLTFFYRYQRQLIEQGMIYIACPPLYKVSYRGGSTRTKEKVEYFYNDESYESFMRKTGPSLATSFSQSVTNEDNNNDAEPATSFAVKNLQIQRFKGLGEMMPTQLWETTMDPTKRTLKLVTIEDASSADHMFRILMGDAIQERKAFIMENVNRLKITDLDF